MTRLGRDRTRGWGWALVGVAVVVPAVWVLVRALGARTSATVDAWAGWANIWGLPIGAAGLALMVFDRAASRCAPRGLRMDRDRVAQIEADLAARVEAFWSREAALRQVTRPAPVPVRWSSSGRPAAGREVVLGDGRAGDWQELPMKGDCGNIVKRFRALPHRQLVILGEPGAGKSVLAMLLTVGLIRRWRPTDPVPVMLAINAWNPHDGLRAFVIDRIAEEYASTLAPFGEPELVAAYLVTAGRVLPILDGLDELPAAWHATALEALDQAAAGGGPLVVTCRAREYERAALSSGRILSRGAVVELEAVSVEQAITYLSHPAPARARWEPVFAELRRDPDGHLARAFATPLMVSLARIAYQDPVSCPADLLTLPTKDAVAGRLIDTFVATAHGRPGDVESVADPQSDCRRSARAARWLGCIAFHLSESGTCDLHWWQIRSGMMSTRPTRTLLMTLGGIIAVPALTVAATGWWMWGGWIGLDAGLATVLVVGLAADGRFRPLWPSGVPPYVARRHRTRRQHHAYRLVLGGVFGLVVSPVVALITHGLLLAALAGLVQGALTACVTARTSPIRDDGSTPWSSMRAHRRRITVAALQQVIVSAFCVPALSWLFLQPARMVVDTVASASIYAIAAAVQAGLLTSIWFRVVHVRLAIQGWLPWRLSRFLHDAHRRGTLRRAGNVWQLRHAIMQDHLARPIRQEVLRRRSTAGDFSATTQLITMVPEEAPAILRALADAGGDDAAEKLADLLARSGAVNELRARADTGDQHAAHRLDDVLAARGEVDELRARADTGDRWASWTLANLFADRGEIDALRARADRGDDHAADRLTELLAARGDLDELRTRADGGDDHAADKLTELLAARGDLDELRTRADTGDTIAALRLVRLLAARGDVEGLRARADAGDDDAALGLADALAERGDVDEALAILHVRVKAGDRWAAWMLADLLAKLGDVDGLRAHATAGNDRAADRLADLLAARGAVDELRARADTGDRHSAFMLANALATRGDIDELYARATAGDTKAARTLAYLLAERGEVDRLRVLARTGDDHASLMLADALAKRGDVDEALIILRTLANAEHWLATEKLMELLIERGELDEPHARAHAADWSVVQTLVNALAKCGDMDEAVAILRARADAGDWRAAYKLNDLLAEGSEVDDHYSRADTGNERILVRHRHLS